ncbi:glycosyltransferase [Actinokineospora sp. G85]|uniref:glycosyltransferase n=1 Tax=Actinokineospora sp. G85 TaxID=3406626 RepID=UPI003C77BC9D
MRVLLSAGVWHSHVTPLLPLSLALRRAGHDVAFVTGPGGVGPVRDVGLTPVSVPPPPPDSFARFLGAVYTPAEMAALDSAARLAVVVTAMADIGVRTRVAEILAFSREWAPDLVIAGIGEFAGLVVASALGVPSAVHAIGPPKSAEVMAGGWKAAAAAAAADLGLPGPDQAGPYLDIWPGALRPPGVEWDFPSGWPLRPEGVLPSPGPTPAVLADLPHERTVYVTGGTSHNTRPGLLESLIAAAAGEPVNVVVTIGSDGDLSRFADQPPNVRVAHFVPQHLLLPHVSAVLCHAGAATTLGALAHGVPLVLTPIATDQFDIAAHATAAGAALTPDPTPGSIAAALHRVLEEPSLSTSAERLATEIRAMPTPDEVAARLGRVARPAQEPR